MKRPKVYLAGGLHSNWQEQVMSAVLGADYFNPRVSYIEAKEKGEWESPQVYVDRDLNWLRECDIIFCYQEETLPDTVNCSWEMGYGFAKGKKIIYVNQRVIDRYVTMASLTSVVYTRDLAEGIEKLKELIKWYS